MRSDNPDDPQAAAYYDVACPKCGAPVGRGCRSASRGKYTAPHAGRKAASRALGTRAAAALKPCRFTFDDDTEFDGFAHGSTWNGFDNVAVTKETLDKIVDWFTGRGGGEETAAEFREIEPMVGGLYSLGWGFATQIVRKEDRK